MWNFCPTFRIYHLFDQLESPTGLFPFVPTLRTLLIFSETNKAKTSCFTSEKNVDILKLCEWIGAVIDAHPTTITADGNEEYLREALAVINGKVN